MNGQGSSKGGRGYPGPTRGFNLNRSLWLCARARMCSLWCIVNFITGPPNSTVLLAGVCRRRVSSSVGSVTLHGRPAGVFNRAGQAITSCRLQCNYSFTVILQGGPVGLRPVRATLCFVNNICFTFYFMCTLFTLRSHAWVLIDLSQNTIRLTVV